MNDLDDVIEEVRFAASQLPPDDMLHDELRFLVELSDTRARLAHEQTTNANLLRALAEAIAALEEIGRIAVSDKLATKAVWEIAEIVVRATVSAEARLAEAEKQIQESHELLLRWHRLYGSQPISQWECLDDDTTTFVWGGGTDRHAARPADSAPAHGGRPMTLREVIDAEEPPSSQNEGEK